MNEATEKKVEGVEDKPVAEVLQTQPEKNIRDVVSEANKQMEFALKNAQSKITVVEDKSKINNNEIATNRYKEYLKTKDLKISGLTLSSFLSENPDLSIGFNEEQMIDLRESIKDGILSDFENQQNEEEKSKEDFLNELQEARSKDIVSAETKRIFLDNLQESRRKDIEGSN